MPPRRESHRLRDILDAIGRIDRHTGGDVPQTTREDPVWDAILYNLAVIGEAIKGLPEETQERAGEVDWSAAARMRDFIIHRYFATDPAVVGSTLEHEIPRLKAAVERLLREAEEL